MQCTFFVDGGILDPWVEDVTDVPPRHDGVIRNGTRWMVREVKVVQKATGGPEAWVLLSLPPRLFDEDAPVDPVRRRARRRNRSRHR